MNNKKISFIICANDELYVQECVFYINELIVPEGYEVDLLTIAEATSICGAYNLAMKSTDAKYKVYLHQDVFLLKKNLLREMLDIFEDASIGMLGVVGTVKIPESARAAAAWNRGNVLLSNGKGLFHMKDLPGEEKVIEVEAIDGMLMATQYDLEWDEVRFDGFHFYDISQSVEFRNAGYKIVVPNDEEIWALHDSGISSEKKYDFYRALFCEKYGQMGFTYCTEDDTGYTFIGRDLEKKKNRILDCYRCEAEETVWQEIVAFEACGYVDMEILKLKNYLEIKRNEYRKNGAAQTCRTVSYQEFEAYYTQLKFWIWRSAFSMNDSEKSRQALWTMLDKGMLTLECLKLMERQFCDGKICSITEIFLENFDR